MPQVPIQKKLAAILVADVVAYTRLMEIDEVGTTQRLIRVRHEIFEPLVKENGGRIFKVTGDGALAEFKSSADAVRAAVSIQNALNEAGLEDPVASKVELRIGISLGDVITQGGDLVGTAVNVAARLESICDPGSVFVSSGVFDQIRSGNEYDISDVGRFNVKNIAEPIRAFRVGIAPTKSKSIDRSAAPEQSIKFCHSIDGVQIAYSEMGEGYPVIYVSNWLSHLELDWQIPSRRGLMDLVTKDHSLIRYDARGNGLSDWHVGDFSLDRWLDDLKAVVASSSLDRFHLIGSSQGAAIAATYAAWFPDRVSKLILFNGYARGRRKRGDPGQIAESDALVTMIREGWGKKIDSYVRMFGSFFMPDANADQMNAFIEFQKTCTSPNNAARIQRAIDDIDVLVELKNVVAPTLVLHIREDARAPFEEGRRMAAMIPDARFVPLEGRNHAMLPGEPALARLLDEINRFLN